MELHPTMGQCGVFICLNYFILLQIILKCVMYCGTRVLFPRMFHRQSCRSCHKDEVSVPQVQNPHSWVVTGALSYEVVDCRTALQHQALLSRGAGGLRLSRCNSRIPFTCLFRCFFLFSPPFSFLHTGRCKFLEANTAL